MTQRTYILMVVAFTAITFAFGLIWSILVASIGLLVGVVRSMWLRSRGSNVAAWYGVTFPWWTDATFAFVAIIGIISTVPGLFFGEPHWAIDHVYRAVSVLLGNAA